MNTAKTARNHLPAIAKLVEKHNRWVPGTQNFDYGSGPYTKFSTFLAEKGVVNWPWDTEHPTALGGNQIYQALAVAEWKDRGGQFDTITISNVLNVLQDDEMHEVLQDVRALARRHPVHHEVQVYVTVWEGDKSGEGAPTRDGYQRNQVADVYIGQIYQYFRDVTLYHDGLIWARLPRARRERNPK